MSNTKNYSIQSNEDDEETNDMAVIREAVNRVRLANNDNDFGRNQQLHSSSERRPGAEWIDGAPLDRENPYIPNVLLESNNAIVVDPLSVDVILTLEGQVVKNKKKIAKLFCIGVCFTLVAIFTTLRLIFFNNSNTLPIKNDSSPISGSRLNSIVVEIAAVSGVPCFERNSPQNKALLWIIEKDEMKLQHNSTNLFQRYALMVLFYSLSGDTWLQNTGFGTGTHECEWFGIDCSRSGHVTTIVLSLNMLKGKFPREIGIFSDLRTLVMPGNEISGTIPTDMGDLKKLFRLNLQNNRLTSLIPSTFENCGNLRFVKLSNNKLNGSFPLFFPFKALQDLILNDNFLSGDISSEVSRYQSLVTLEVTNNKFNGTIPTEIALIPTLEILSLSENKFSGSIPFNVGNLTLLRILRLKNNEIHGTIPQSATRLSELISFDTSNNNIIGTIPDKISSITALHLIDFSDNAMNGTIPSSLTHLTDLKILKLHHNNFTGTVANSTCDKLEIFSTDCANPSLGVLCNCCTTCY